MSNESPHTIPVPWQLEKEELDPKPFVARVVELRVDENPMRVIIEIEGNLHSKSP
jgi:hypothetical protein